MNKLTAFDALAEFHGLRPARGDHADRGSVGSCAKRRGRPPKEERMEPFCIRLCPKVRSRLERAADLSNARSVAAWAREILGSAADAVLAEPPETK